MCWTLMCLGRLIRVINFRQWGQACLPGTNCIYIVPISKTYKVSNSYFSVLNIWCIVLWCSFKLKTLLKTFSQSWHVSGSSDPCCTLMCRDKLFFLIGFVQCGQLVIIPPTNDYSQEKIATWQRSYKLDGSTLSGDNPAIHSRLRLNMDECYPSRQDLHVAFSPRKVTSNTYSDRLCVLFSCAPSS